jgi:hypothetical protein
MKRRMNATCWVLAGMLATTSALAEQYDFAAGLAFDNMQFSGSQTIEAPGGTILNSGEIDTDNLSVFGSWYFAGLSDDNGPRVRAALVDRASSVSVGYHHSEQTISTFVSSENPAFPVQPIDSTLDSDGDSFTVDLRYVNRDNGWFGNAGLLRSDTTLSGLVDDSIDVTGWTLGGGKYLFETTTVGLDVAQVDHPHGLDATIVAVKFSHLGNLSERWQYAIDLGYSRTDQSAGSELDTWDAAVALYPTRDFEFGLAVEDISDDGTGVVDSTGIEGFASWFVTQNIRLSARYRSADVNYLGNISIGGAPTVSDADQDTVGLSATVRF